MCSIEVTDNLLQMIVWMWVGLVTLTVIVMVQSMSMRNLARASLANTTAIEIVARGKQRET